MPFAVVEPTTATTTEVVAAVANKSIHFWIRKLSTDTAQYLEFQDASDTAAARNGLYAAANGGERAPGGKLSDIPDGICTEGEALSLVTNAAGNTFAKVWYEARG